jgi:hypothetical protein
MLGGLPHRLREDPHEGMDVPELFIKMGSSVSRIKRRSSSVGFPLMAGKELCVSLKRSVIALGIVMVTYADFLLALGDAVLSW